MHELTKQQEGTFYTISASFINDTSGRQYTYKVPIEAFCEPGNLAVVETNSGYKLVEVQAVHEVPEIDYSKPYEYRWIAYVADITWWEQQKQVESKWRTANAQRRKINVPAVDRL